MIKHIVMWKLKEFAEGRSKKENAAYMKNMLENLKEFIPEIVEIEAGANFNEGATAFDIALYSVFRSVEDLETYQKHPEHQKIADYINKVRDERVVVDYEV
jgi:hypothetical protein